MKVFVSKIEADHARGLIEDIKEGITNLEGAFAEDSSPEFLELMVGTMLLTQAGPKLSKFLISVIEREADIVEESKKLDTSKFFDPGDSPSD